MLSDPSLTPLLIPFLTPVPLPLLLSFLLAFFYSTSNRLPLSSVKNLSHQTHQRPLCCQIYRSILHLHVTWPTSDIWHDWSNWYWYIFFFFKLSFQNSTFLAFLPPHWLISGSFSSSSSSPWPLVTDIIWVESLNLFSFLSRYTLSELSHAASNTIYTTMNDNVFFSLLNSNVNVQTLFSLFSWMLWWAEF